MAAQLILMKGPSFRDELSCKARATSSLPVPDSPVISTVDGVFATFSTTWYTCLMAFELPTNRNLPDVVGSSGRASRRESICVRMALATIWRICSWSNGFST